MAHLSCNWNEAKSTCVRGIDWTAGLVPAAAVIPAPTMYIKADVVKMLVIDRLHCDGGPLSG